MKISSNVYQRVKNPQSRSYESTRVSELKIFASQVPHANSGWKKDWMNGGKD